MLTNWRRRATQHPWSFDVALGVVLTACGLFSTELSRRLADEAELDFAPGWGVVSTVAIGLAIVVRRRWPLAALSAVSVVYSVAYRADATEGIFSSIAIFIALYSAGAYGRRPAAHWVRAVNVAAIAALIAWSVLDTTDFDDTVGAELASVRFLVVLLNVFYFVAAWLLGDLTHAQRRREAVLQRQAAELTDAHAEIARRAVIDERLRIARELHDVVAHHVSTMGVQAGAARRVLDRSPESVTEALTNIEASSRQAVAELHALLGVLRSDGDADVDPLGPTPRLRDLGHLVEQIEHAGVSVSVGTTGLDEPLPPGIELSAYRIVQEALTNVVKHAGQGATAEVVVERSGETLTVEVTDDGGRPAASVARSAPGATHRPATGQGITGMRERVALHDGQLGVGQRADGRGYRVRAVFPLARHAPATSGRPPA